MSAARIYRFTDPNPRPSRFGQRPVPPPPSEDPSAVKAKRYWASKAGQRELAQRRAKEAEERRANEEKSRQFWREYDERIRRLGVPFDQSTYVPLGAFMACEALGIASTPRPTRATVIAAHRALIRKAHPDLGGSAEDAARLNAARDTILTWIGPETA